MSKPSHAPSPFTSIDLADLDKVAGGASRVSSRAGGASEELTTMLTQITDSIKSLATQQNQGQDPMQLMLMMMMMGGMGGGGGGAAPAAAAPPPGAVVNVCCGKRRC